jgi:hypothetical protein
MEKEKKPLTCSICGQDIKPTSFGWDQGNNAQPINDGRCCDDCDTKVVLPARMVEVGKFMKQQDKNWN